MNRDTAEIDKFAALAHQWWDEDGELRTLHQLNPLRLTWIETQAGGLGGKAVLDIGCGGGILAESMAKKGAAQVLGIDLADKSLKIAKLHALEHGVKNLSYQSIAAEDLAAAQAGQFDVVTCMEMLEHVPDPASIVRAAAQALRPGGVAVFSTINRNARAWSLAIVAAEYMLRLVPRGTHHYDKLVRPSELALWARQAGLTLRASSGVTYNPLTRRMALTDDARVNYMLAFEKQI
jgi:2-polyprenyl-6-hydroxyphenyl methylase/3-demethylubiquinone-9 3-methyltransferase